MPLSHWAFELDFGSKTWLPNLLGAVNIDPNLLAHRADASALQFESTEESNLKTFVKSLVDNLTTSDFMLAFPDHPVLCTIHHHKQLWWTTSDNSLLERIN